MRRRAAARISRASDRSYWRLSSAAPSQRRWRWQTSGDAPGRTRTTGPAGPDAASWQRAILAGADTVNRELSVFKAATTWWRSRGWITTSPVAGIERRPAPPDRTRALARRQIDDLYEVKAGLREKTLRRLLFESAARAGEVLSLNIEDLALPGKRAKVIAKGGATEWIHWQSPTAQLLPRLISGRTRGPLFLTERMAPSWTPTPDVCPATKRARLSYRRAAEMFEEATRAWPTRASPTKPNSRSTADGPSTSSGTPR
ncbi:MAG: hypothetical protein ACRDOL_37730 [Streptosporangiaceae bacterium]